MGLGLAAMGEVFDADVQLLPRDLQPKAAARSESLWLWDLPEPEHSTVKIAGFFFRPGRYTNLDMVDALNLQGLIKKPSSV